MKGEIKNIQLEDIVNYNKNPRHSVGNDEIETLKNLFDKVGNQYMINLAEDIFNNDLLPIDIITVVYSEEMQKYIVFEGNRRVACIKLLMNPDEFIFLDSNTINKIKKTTSSGFKYDFSKIQAYVTDEEEGFYIMEKVHTGEDQGRGRKAWSSREKDIFKSRRNNTKTMALMIDQYVRKYKDNFDITMILPFTTLDRIFNNREIKQRIGINLEDENSFTKERIELIIYICRKSAEKAKSENQGVSRIFNKSRIIEDIVLPWIDVFYDDKEEDKEEKSSKTDNKNNNNAENKDNRNTGNGSNSTENNVKILLKDIVTVQEGTELYLKSSDITNISANQIAILKSNNFMMNEYYIFQNTNTVGEYIVEYLYKDNIAKLKVIVEKKSDNTNQKNDNNQKGNGGKNNLPYFFSGIGYGHLNSNDADTHGVARICHELRLFSSKKYVLDFPISSAFLVRAIIEHSLILYSKKNKIQGQDKVIWLNISDNGKAKNLYKIIDNYNKNLPNYIGNTNIREYFTKLFSNYNENANPLNWVIHRPEEYVLAPDKLVTLPSEGLLTVINYLIKEQNVI